MTVKLCEYWDCGWCYAPDNVPTNDVNGECNKPVDCPSCKYKSEEGKVYE